MEAETHYYNPSHTTLFQLGFQPHPLRESVLIEMIEIVRSFRDRIDSRHIYPEVRRQ
jgi:hypothetical protein